MGDKQEELEAMGQQESCDILAIMEHGGWHNQRDAVVALNSSEGPGEEGEVVGSPVF